MAGLMDRGRALVGKIRSMPSVLDQERQRQQQVRPLIQSGQYRAAMGIPSAMEGFGTADVGAIGGLMGGIKAYHGSPHAFKKFDSKQIGTGEGAQAYGQGLYFAESPGVAKNYRDTLSMGQFTRPTSEKHGLLMARWQEVDDLAKKVKAQPDNPNWQRRLDDVTKEAEALGPKPGHIYEVDIDAKPEQFLDWDAPLKEQPKVLEAFENHPDWEVFTPKTGERRLYRGDEDFGALSAVTGRQLNEYLAKNPSGLAEAGIPGIRYKDAMSRGSGGKDTSNYVVFPGQESRVRIDRINDQPTVMGQEAMLDAMTGGAATPPSMMPRPQGLMSGQGAIAAGRQAALPKGTGGVNLKKIRQLFKASKDIGEQRRYPR